MGRHAKKSIAAAAKALEATHGLIAPAAERLGISRNTLSSYVEHSLALKQICEQERESFVDLGESKLMQAVSNSEPWAVQLLLKTIGRKRGYVEKQEVEHSGSTGIETVVHFHLAKKRQESVGKKV